MSSDLPPIPSNITAITAPQILGTLFNWCLYGVLSVQTYVYYLNFPDDKLFAKCLVYGTYLFETVQTCLSAVDLYYWFAAGYGNTIHLANVYISTWDTPFLCGIIAAVVQCFFAYRIWMLQKNYLWLCILIVLMAMFQTAGAFGTAFRGQALHDFNRLRDNVMFPASFHVWLLGDTVADILIAGSMLYIFHKSKKEEYLHMNKVLARVVRLVIETNTLTAGMALLTFILYAAFPTYDYFICTALVMGKLYSNTLLVTFNNRIALRNIGRGSTGSALRLSQNENFESSFRSTYHIGRDRFQNGTKPQGFGDIEIGVLKEAKVHNGLGSSSHVPPV